MCTTAGTAGAGAVFTELVPQTVWTTFKTADTTRNNDATLADDPHLAIASLAGRLLHRGGAVALRSEHCGRREDQLGRASVHVVALGALHHGIQCHVRQAHTWRNSYLLGNTVTLGGVGATTVDARPQGLLTISTAGTLKPNGHRRPPRRQTRFSARVVAETHQGRLGRLLAHGADRLGALNVLGDRPQGALGVLADLCQRRAQRPSNPRNMEAMKDKSCASVEVSPRRFGSANARHRGTGEARAEC